MATIAGRAGEGWVFSFQFSVFSFQFSVLKFERQSLAFLTRNVAVFEPKRSALVWNILLFST